VGFIRGRPEITKRKASLNRNSKHFIQVGLGLQDFNFMFPSVGVWGGFCSEDKSFAPEWLPA
jgi:hypothetical protein